MVVWAGRERPQLLRRGAFRNIVNVLIGGRVETWAPDVRIDMELRGGADHAYTWIDGVDADNYTPTL